MKQEPIPALEGHPDGGTRYHFEDQAERDAYIDEHWPRRWAQPAPGYYELPDNGALVVWMNTVRHYP